LDDFLYKPISYSPFVYPEYCLLNRGKKNLYFEFLSETFNIGILEISGFKLNLFRIQIFVDTFNTFEKGLTINLICDLFAKNVSF